MGETATAGYVRIDYFPEVRIEQAWVAKDTFLRPPSRRLPNVVDDGCHFEYRRNPMLASCHGYISRVSRSRSTSPDVSYATQQSELLLPSRSPLNSRWWCSSARRLWHTCRMGVSIQEARTHSRVRRRRCAPNLTVRPTDPRTAPRMGGEWRLGLPNSRASNALTPPLLARLGEACGQLRTGSVYDSRTHPPRALYQPASIKTRKGIRPPVNLFEALFTLPSPQSAHWTSL